MKPLALLAGIALFCPALAPAADALTIAVIPKATSHEFWKSIHAGAIKARDELRADGTRLDIIWQGPLREDNRDQQIQVVENFISRRVSGIVLAPTDARALVAPVNTAARAKVPVVIMDSGLKSENYVSYVATDNYKGGVLAGEQMVKLLGGRGNVILLRYQAGSASTEEREAGFLDTIRKHPGLKILSSDQHGGATRELCYQAAQNLLNRHGREVNGLFGPCEPVANGLIMALRNTGRAGGTVKVVGFDAGGQTLEALRKGDVQAVIVQDPLRMGYLAVKTLAAHLAGRPVEKRLDTGVHVITPDNMDTPAMKELLNPPLEKYLK